MEINGKPVVNSKRKFSIEISARDVRLGNTKDPGGCAAARCLMRTVPGIKSARVHMSVTYLEFAEHWERLMTPDSLRSEILAFDRGARFYPGTYNLAPLSPAMQAKHGARQGGPDNPKRKKKKVASRPYHVTKGVRERGANK